MLIFTCFTIFGQIISGSAYVVVENSYDPSWQHHQFRTIPVIYQPVQCPSYNWVYHYAKQLENLELKTLRDREMINFNLLKCLIEEEKRDVCKAMLESAKTPFESSQKIKVSNENTSVLFTQKQNGSQPTTVAQPYPTELEENTLLNKNQEEAVTNAVVLETRNKEAIPSEIQVQSSIEETKSKEKKTQPVEDSVKPVEVVDKIEESSLTSPTTEDNKTMGVSSDKAVIKVTGLPTDSGASKQLQGHLLSIMSMCRSDKAEESAQLPES